MAYRILSAAFGACLAGLSAVPASAAETATSNTQCRDGWYGGHYFYKCVSLDDSKYATTRTECAAGPIDSACVTTSEDKPQAKPPEPPKPYQPPSVERSWSGPLIMRGMPQPDARETRIHDGHGPR
jgi:hypothetical protein